MDEVNFALIAATQRPMDVGVPTVEGLSPAAETFYTPSIKDPLPTVKRATMRKKWNGRQRETQSSNESARR
jgi:hypothetical protein